MPTINLESIIFLTCTSPTANPLVSSLGAISISLDISKAI